MIASTDILISLCLECGAVYKTAPAHRKIGIGEYSHGYCDECLPIVELRWQKQIQHYLRVSEPDGPIADSPDGYKIIGGNV